MCLCVHVFACVFIYVNVCVCFFEHVCVYNDICMFLCACVLTRFRILFVGFPGNACMYVCMYARVSVCVIFVSACLCLCV